MPSEIKTPNIGLNQWSGNEYLKRQDFVDDNAIIDKVLANTAKFEKAGGTATAIILSGLDILSDGVSKTFIINANNAGAATTINSKSLYKPGTTAAPTLIAGKAVTVWYDEAGDCFFIKASAEGTAKASSVLAGETFSNDDDTGLVGTMTNHNSDGNGYNNMNSVADKVWVGSYPQPRVHFPILPGAYIVPTPDKGVPMGYIDSADLKAENIAQGKSIFGVVGSAVTGGKKFVSGTVTSSSDQLYFLGGDNANIASYYITVSGLTFLPSMIVIIPTQEVEFGNVTIYKSDCIINNNGFTTDIFCSTALKASGVSQTVRNLKLGGNSYVNASSFRLPVLSLAKPCRWMAFE